MAARAVGLLQDQNLGVHMDGTSISEKANFTGQRKGRAGGRKPLGDLSNSGKLSINQTDGRRALDNGKQRTSISGKANFAGQRKAGAGGRKPLGDISNSGKLSMNQPDGRKALGSGKQGKTKKLATVKGEPVPINFKNLESKRTASKASEKALSDSDMDVDAIAEEQCLHDHQKCIELQSEALALCHFFEIVGLKNGN